MHWIVGKIPNMGYVRLIPKHHRIHLNQLFYTWASNSKSHQIVRMPALHSEFPCLLQAPKRSQLFCVFLSLHFMIVLATIIIRFISFNGAASCANSFVEMLSVVHGSTCVLSCADIESTLLPFTPSIPQSRFPPLEVVSGGMICSVHNMFA